MPTLTRAIAAVAILAAAGTAAAQPSDRTDAPSIAVSFADLDLGSHAGLRTLEGRVHAAASRLCVQAGRKSLERQLAERRCMSAAMSSGQAGIDRAVAQRTAQTPLQSKAQVAAR